MKRAYFFLLECVVPPPVGPPKITWITRIEGCWFYGDDYRLEAGQGKGACGLISDGVGSPHLGLSEHH